MSKLQVVVRFVGANLVLVALGLPFFASPTEAGWVVYLGIPICLLLALHLRIGYLDPAGGYFLRKSLLVTSLLVAAAYLATCRKWLAGGSPGGTGSSVENVELLYVYNALGETWAWNGVFGSVGLLLVVLYRFRVSRSGSTGEPAVFSASADILELDRLKLFGLAAVVLPLASFAGSLSPFAPLPALALALVVEQAFKPDPRT